MAKAKKQVVKDVPNMFTLYDDDSIVVRNVRLSYPHVDKPKPPQDGKGEPTFSCVGLIDKVKQKATFLQLRDMVRAMIAEHKLKDLPDERKCLRDGDKSGKESHEGSWTINTREKAEKPPILRDEKNMTVERADAAGKFYGGCYGDILLRLWWQDNKHGKRVNANLLAVQFKRHGEAFGEGRISDDDADEIFEGVDDDDSGYDAGAEDDDEL